MSKKDPKTMTAREINAELDKLNKQDGDQIDKLIAAGRGKEKYRDVVQGTDPLSIECRETWERQKDLWSEIEVRLGYRSYRLPLSGFGPRK